MMSHRNGAPVLVCDGCHKVIGPARRGDGEVPWVLVSGVPAAWTTPDGRTGHVHDTRRPGSKCGPMFDARPAPKVAERAD